MMLQPEFKELRKKSCHKLWQSLRKAHNIRHSYPCLLAALKYSDLFIRHAFLP